MTKWKRREITPTRGNRCVDHAFSVMRLALGYKKGLPDDWEEADEKKEGYNRDNADVCRLAQLAFPKHHLLVLYPNTLSVFDDPYWDDYLLCFSYLNKSEGNIAHMVLGMPWEFGEMAVVFVMAVSIERKWK